MANYLGVLKAQGAMPPKRLRVEQRRLREYRYQRCDRRTDHDRSRSG